MCEANGPLFAIMNGSLSACHSISFSTSSRIFLAFTSLVFMERPPRFRHPPFAWRELLTIHPLGLCILARVNLYHVIEHIACVQPCNIAALPALRLPVG